MKKLLTVLMLLLIITLSGCELINDNNNELTCEQDPTQDFCEIEEKTCEEDPTQDFCNIQEIELIEECQHLNIDEDGWIPVWCEEFNYTGMPNSQKWSYDVGGGGWGNNELQYYTEGDSDNAIVENGKLIITAIKEDYLGNEYTSARLVTRNKADWKYGKIEVYAKLPSGTGTWPAIWMLPTDWIYGNWPASGEIDIMEFVGYNPGVIYGTIHTDAYNHSLGTQLGGSKVVSDASDEFHLYSIIWERDFIQFYVDGIKYYSVAYNPTTNIGIDNYAAWPFDQDFHLILNLAVGGNWGGAYGVDPNIWPQTLEVDYVRVYQKDYITNDSENPTEIDDLEVNYSGVDFVNLTWEKATDDMSIKHYNIYVDGILKGITTLNNFKIKNLISNTQYIIGIEAVDYAGNKSSIVTGLFSTQG